MKYFLQVSELHREKNRNLVNDSNVVGGKSEVQYSSEISWKRENEYGDKTNC